MSYSHPAPELWWLMFPEWPSRSWRAVEPTKFKCACVCVRWCVWCICGCIHPHMHSGQGRMSSVLLCRCLPYFLDTEFLNEPGTGLVAANPSILLSLPLPLSTVVTGYTQPSYGGARELNPVPHLWTASPLPADPSPEPHLVHLFMAGSNLPFLTLDSVCWSANYSVLSAS